MRPNNQTQRKYIKAIEQIKEKTKPKYIESVKKAFEGMKLGRVYVTVLDDDSKDKYLKSIALKVKIRGQKPVFVILAYKNFDTWGMRLTEFYVNG